MVNIKSFHSDLLKIDNKSYKNIDICYIGYITIKYTDYVIFQSVSPLLFLMDKADSYIEESNGN